MTIDHCFNVYRLTRALIIISGNYQTAIGGLSGKWCALLPFLLTQESWRFDNNINKSFVLFWYFLNLYLKNACVMGTLLLIVLGSFCLRVSILETWKFHWNRSDDALHHWCNAPWYSIAGFWLPYSWQEEGNDELFTKSRALQSTLEMVSIKPIFDLVTSTVLFTTLKRALGQSVPGILCLASLS